MPNYKLRAVCVFCLLRHSCSYCFPLLDINMSPIMGMRRIASRDRLKMLSPGGGALFNVDGNIVPVSVGNTDMFQANVDKIKRVSSSSSISSLGMLLYM